MANQSSKDFPETKAFVRNMEQEGIDFRSIKTFIGLYQHYRERQTGKISWSEIHQPLPTDFIDYEKMLDESNFTRGCRLLNQLVVIRLNGGLGTSMKLHRAKSLIPVRDEWSFLELAARQILKLRENYGSPVPWLLMNSFHTREDSLAVLSSYPLTVQGLPLDFLQSKVPRIDRATALPTDFENPEDNWAPPGHGDIFFSLWTSRLLDDLLQRGIRWAFISNIDNLGATVVPHILGYLDHQGLEFAMEVADKSLADIKGGTLIRHQGRLTLLESAQVEDSHIQEFQDINVFSVFNSNNLWVRLDTLRNILEHQHLELPMIINPKIVQGREIIQLETAMGAAISNFSHAVGILIPRSRFIPVKTTDDLFAVRSDAYVLEEDFSLGPNPARSTHLGPPIIQLDPRYYMGIEDFEARIPYPLSLLQCRRLTVEGDIYFGEKVRIEGDVTLTNKLAQSTIIPDSTLFHSGHHSV